MYYTFYIYYLYNKRKFTRGTILTLIINTVPMCEKLIISISVYAKECERQILKFFHK